MCFNYIKKYSYLYRKNARFFIGVAFLGYCGKMSLGDKL